MSPVKSKNIFLTGATGGLGQELVRLFLERTEDRLFLLVRPKNGSHEQRVEKLLERIGANGTTKKRIEVFAGDVTRPRLGLSEKEWLRAARETDEFYHCAALTSLGAERKEAERINVGGTSRALELAGEAQAKGRLERFFYFSTAFVAGSLTPIHALEDELPRNPSFANAYEETKFLAERKVREEMRRGLPATIFRPSIVVGDSKEGAIGEFNVVYPFWRLFAHGLLRRVPSRPDHFFNIVPIDFVVEASFLLARHSGSLGKTFHLVSEKPPTLKMLLEVKEEFDHFPPVEVIPPEEFSLDTLDPEERAVFSSLKPYLGYLAGTLTFDTRNTRDALQGTEIDFPTTDRAFLKRIVAYAVQKGYFLPTTAR